MEKHGQHFQTLLEQKIIIKVKLCLKLRKKSEANTKVLDMQLWYKAAKKKEGKNEAFDKLI